MSAIKIAKPLNDLITSFHKLPGIGPKSAQKLAYYLLHVPQSELDKFADSVSRIKIDTKLCSICKNIAEEDPCPVCEDESRDQTVITVVEQPLDIIVFERTGKFKGLYHVLHGVIDPLENIGPDELFIEALLSRVRSNKGIIKEVIIATNPTMEGEATAMYLLAQLKNIPETEISVSRLGMGMPTGAALEYADEMTLIHALNGRRSV